MRLHSVYVVAGSVVVGVLAGWGIGSAGGDCEYSCPATGHCSPPADCGQQPFNWLGAVVVGIVAAAIVGGLALLVVRRHRDE